jgi:hypothetical protein
MCELPRKVYFQPFPSGNIFLDEVLKGILEVPYLAVFYLHISLFLSSTTGPRYKRKVHTVVLKAHYRLIKVL